MDLDAYRAQAESFYSELGRAEYRHFAGHDPELPLERIYASHAALFERDAVLGLQELVHATTPGGDGHRRACNLWDFALEGHIGQLTKRVEEELVLTPIGGREDFAILFHEAGHAEQFAHMAPELPFEFRCLGDAAATEAFAFLLQHLTDDPGWLAQRLGIDDASGLADFARVSRFIYLRQYAAKLSYELELHGGERPLDEMADRYSRLLGDGLGLPWAPDTFLSDVDPGFYCAGYLRAWAMEAQLRRYLRERFGDTWFAAPEAGRVLRSAWRDGLRLNAEEMLQELTGETLDFGILLTDLGLAGSAAS